MDRALAAAAESDGEPSTYREATNGPDASKRLEATNREYSSLVGNETWRLVPKPKGANVVGVKWVFKIKRDQMGAIEKYKARL